MTLAAAFTPGEVLPALRRAVTRDDIRRYAEASGDHNRIHLDEGFARAAGLPGVIAHGLLEMGILAEAVVSWSGGAELLSALSCRFSRPLVAGDTITCTGRVLSVQEDLAQLELEGVSGSGERVLSRGRATVRLRP